MRATILFCVFLLILSGCSKDPEIYPYQSKNVIIIVVDGARYSETWGNNGIFIPFRYGLREEAFVCKEMYNLGETRTISGHANILTGYKEVLDNGGGENPEYENFLQVARKYFSLTPEQCWIISSKDKIEAIANCKNSQWKDLFLPSVDCGINGLGTGYRHDTITQRKVLEVLANHHPRFMLINFREPDFTAHNNDSLGYLNGIRMTDSLSKTIWDYLNNDIIYKNNTTFIITNDHGRHLDNNGGFSGHGDGCAGCRHIEFFALGPDIKKGNNSNMTRNLSDINATIAELIGIKMPHSEGKVMKEMFNNY